MKKEEQEQEQEQEQGGDELQLENFQHSLRGDSPLYSYYMQLCSRHSGADRYALVLLLATEVGVWPRKAKSSRAVLEGEEPEEKLQEFFAEVFKKIAPTYGRWKTARVEKGKFSFDDFITTLDVFYDGFVVKSSKDGSHFMRKGTEKYRAKYDLKEATLFARQDGKAYPPYFTMIAGSDYPFTNKSQLPNPEGDKIQIDHILSCQVFSAMLKKCRKEYSFDRFYSLKTWLNKCWNFLAVPAKVNNRKGHLEKQIIKLIDSKCQPWNGGRDVLWGPLSQDEDQVLRDYFGLVAETIQANAKKSFLKQAVHIRKFLLKFLESLGAGVAVEAMNPAYGCQPGCFCLAKNQSKRERLLTYHLYSDVQLPDVFAAFTADTQALLARAKAKLAEKRPTAKQAANNHYRQLRQGKNKKKNSA